MSARGSGAEIGLHHESGGAGPAVLLLHPNHATSAAWHELGWTEALVAAGLRWVALDLRGFGASAAVADAAELRPGSSTTDLEAVLDALAIPSAYVVGYSLGAAQAVRFAIDRPARVRSLVLGGLALGPLVQCGLCAGADAEADRRRAFEQLEGVPILSERDRLYFEAVRRVISDARLRALASGALRLPVLCVAADRDRFDPPSLYPALRSAGASLVSVTIPAASHSGCFSDARFRDTALAFLARAAALELAR